MTIHEHQGKQLFQTHLREIHIALPSPDKLAQWTATVVAIDASG